MRRIGLVSSLLLSLAATIGAQVPVPPHDTTRRDSVGRDSIRPVHSLAMYPLVAAGAIIAILAPPAMMLLPTIDTATTPGTAPLLASTSVLLYGAAGPGDDDRERTLWAVTQGVELFHRGLYAEARLEQFGLHDRNVRLRTFRAGYLARRGIMLGGITAGVRAAAPEGGLHGLEVALPLVIGGPAGEMRLEPLYLVSSRGVSWNYRYQAELAVPRTPMIGGARITSHAFEGDPAESNVVLSLLVGIRR